MPTSDLLLHRYNGEELVPTRLPVDQANRALADETIGIFSLYVGNKRLELDEELSVLEGTDTDYRVKRGLAHLLQGGFYTFETPSPLEPVTLREKVFSLSARRPPSPQTAALVVQEVAATLSPTRVGVPHRPELNGTVVVTAQADGTYRVDAKASSTESAAPDADEAENTPTASSSPTCDPSGPDRDCGDFSFQTEAQAFFEAAGEGDPHRLDSDGVVCESLP